MDRFVTRAPTWKTMNYTSMAAQKNSILSKKSASQPVDNKKKPLKQKQLSELKIDDFDKRLDDLFRVNQATTENFNANSNDSGLSSASSISPQQLDENIIICNASPSKKFRTPTKNNLGKLGDYVDCPTEKENDTCMTITRTPKSHKKTEFAEVYEKFVLTTTTSPTKPYATSEKALHTAGNMIMARIQRDLNSPSAAVRVRALKAIKSPTKSVYSHFDVPEAEQSLYIPEPPSLQEIMRNIVVYVEVRSGEDNRSAGVRKVIEALGARVNLSLKSDTTHVVFKDGLISTFKKATQMSIPVVSILWIEACKNQRRICDPKDYPISNLDRYENPELYTKMKRVKSMQPDSECNKRVRAKAAGGGGGATQKDLTPTQKTAGAIKKTSTFNGDTPTSSTNKKKTDISQFFKKLERPTTNAGGDASGGGTALIESPTTQLLNRINSECYTPLEQLKQKDKEKQNKIEIYDEESREGHYSLSPSKSSNNNAKKALDFLHISDVEQTTNEQKQIVANNSPYREQNVNTRRRSSATTSTAQAILDIGASLRVNMNLLTTPSSAKKDKPQRRHSLMPAGELEIATTSMNTMAISNTPSSKNTRRRSSINTPRDMTMETPGRIQLQPVILEEVNELDTEPQIEKPKAPIKPPRSINTRRTLYDAKTMNQTDLIKTNEMVETTPNKSTRRRTIYASKTMETSGDEEIKTKVPNKRRTCFNLKTLEQTEIQNTLETATPTNNKTHSTMKKNKDLLKEKTKEETPTTSNKTQRRRTLFTPQNVNDSEIVVVDKSSISANVTSGSCVTPTNFLQRKIASSTLLEDSINRSKLVATPPPPADATVGKLLEETNECATPLIFSSNRQPSSNRRRTLFDVSMDIITQRLQCINQSARKSLAAPSIDIPSSKDIQTDVNVHETPKSNNLEYNNNTNTPQSSLPPSALHTLVNESKQDDGEEEAKSLGPEINTIKKKRKLFMPNDMLLTPPAASSNIKKTLDDLTMTPAISGSIKKRRTLMPISQPQPTTTTTMVTLKDPTTTTTPSARKRRSTLDFEQIQNINSKSNNNNITTLYKNKKTEFAFDSSASTSSSSTTTADVIKKKIATTTNLTNDMKKKQPVLVYTNMHNKQIDVIREAIKSLGTFSLESCVTDSTTHLVSLEPRRTLNLLKAVVRGLWIVEYSWLTESVQAGKWLPEEPYELRNFSRAIEICRSERQAFGERYKCELFRKIGSFYISSINTPMSKENLCELVRLCGGHIVMTRQKARYIIGDVNGQLEDKLYLSPFWILDSITQMQLMKIKKYSYPLASKNSIDQKINFEKNSQV